MTEPSKPTKPIFLHGMWRCGSTFVWSRFRQLDETYCYFEPLIEGLAKLTPERINRATEGVIARNRHPKLAQPYLKEFESLIKQRGVTNYQRKFATKDFLLLPEKADPALEKFITTLLDQAESKNATAVLGFNRTVLRTAWFKQNFDSINIHIDRDPFEVWASYMEHRNKDDNTFLTRWMMVADVNRHQPLFRSLIDRLDIPTLTLAKIGRRKKRYGMMLDALTPAKLYDFVFTMWLATILQALTHCDFILDINRADDTTYREHVSQTIHVLSGLSVPFDELRAPGKASAITLPDQVDIEAGAIRAFPLEDYQSWFDKNACLARLSDLTDRKADLLRQLLN